MFFASPLILVYIILKVLQKEKWRSTQKILAGIDLNDFEVFENVQIQTSSYSHFKVISGIPHKGRLLVNNSRFIALTDKIPSFLTYNSTLPLDINSNQKDVQFEMKIWEVLPSFRPLINKYKFSYYDDVIQCYITGNNSQSYSGY